MAIDKLNFSGINSGSGDIVSPMGSIADRLMKYGNYMVTQSNDDERLKLQQDRDAYQRGRDAITDARLNKQEARQDKEQAANDMFYTEFAKGPQNKGGLYGDLIAKESDKYALTDDEIGLATKYKNDPLLARSAGQNALADKIDWQLKAGEKANTFVASNIDDETRPEMYDRIGSLIASKGYTPPKELIIASDQARLAETTAEEAKAKLLDDRRSEIEKNQTSNLWRVVNSKGNEQTGTDSEGNPIQISTGSKGSSTQNRFNNGFNDDLSKGSNDITEAIAKNAKGATDTSKALTSSDALKFYNKLVKEEGIDPSVASAQIVNGISSQDPKWYQWLTDKEAKFSKDAIAQLLPTLKETSDIKKRTDIANGTNTGISSKEQAANDLAIALGEKDKLDIAKINADRAKLLLTPEERRISKANQWLEREGILGKSSSEPVNGNNIDSVQTKTPGSENNSKAEGNTLADRNFNPGNIRITKDNWLGGSAGEKGFVKFQTPELGARGLAKTIINGGVGSTIEQYISKYAPESDNNDTSGYIKMVSKSLGKDPSEKILKEDVPALMKVIARKEGGKFSDNVLDYGYKLAIGEKNVEDHIKDSAGKIRLQSTKYGKQEDFTDSNAFNRYYENNGGLFDRNKNILDIMVDKKIGRHSAEKYYDEVVKPEVNALKKSLNKENYVGEKVYSNEEEYRNSDEYKQLNSPQQVSVNKPIDYINAGLGTANSIAADAINIAMSPYNTLRHGFDYIAGRPFTKGYTENAATNAENVAIDRLSKVTDYPEEALIGASLLSPSISGKARAFAGNGIKSLRNIISPNNVPFRVESIADDIASPENTSVINKFGLTANKKAKVNTDGDLKESINSRLNKNLQVQDITDKNTAQMFWNGVADAYAKGQIPKEKVMEKMQELNESRFIGTKDLMLTIDGAVSKVSQELGNDVSKLRSELSELNNRKPGRPSAEYIKQTNELMDKLEKAIVKKEKYDLSNKSK